MGQKLLNRETGHYDLVDDADLQSALAATGPDGGSKYVAPDAVAAHRTGDDTYTTPELLQREGSMGIAHAIDPAQLETQRGHKIREDRNSGVIGGAKAIAGGFASGLSMGEFSPFQEAQEFHSGLATTGEVAGVVAPMLLGDEANLVALIARDGAEAERAGSVLSSKFLFSGEAGAEAGSAAKSVERGLTRAGAALDESKAVAHAAPELMHLDAAGLKAEREAELARIEGSRVPRRQAFAGELGQFRNTLKNEDKIFLATKGIKETALPAEAGADALKIQEIGKIHLEADNQINRLLRNPKALADKPERALSALQQQENALEQLAKRETTLRKLFAADTSGERAAALDRVPAALERNRQLQGTIRDLISTPASDRLSAIERASEALKAGGAKGSLAEGMLGGSIMGHVAGMFSGLPVIGPMIGAKAGQLATDLVFGRLGKATAVAGERAAASVAKFLDVAKAGASTPQSAVLATKTLAKLAFGPREPANDNSLPALYKARTQEIKRQTYYAADGSVQMRPEARAAVAAKLSAIRAVAPIVADKFETLASRRLAFLSSKIPRRPDMLASPGGPDHWQPSELEMRTFARYAAAVEDPAGVLDRLAHGSITPEDGEAFRTVYPELFAKVQASIAARLPMLRKTLSYQRRVALSIFSGVPVDPAMKPEILAVLQSNFEEPGTEQGTQPPTANPQFGSIQKSTPSPTPAQERAG